MTGAESPVDQGRSQAPEPDPLSRSSAGTALRVVADLLVPLALFYGLRAAGVGIYLALLAGALGSVLVAAVMLIRNRTMDGLAVYVVTTMLVGVGVSLLTGSPRFLLAKEGWVTGIAGVWFLASVWTRRPLAYRFSHPLLEGRLGWPGSWESLWDRAPGFRRMWRISSVLWGVGTLLDSALRVVMAYTLPMDLVPALSTALYAVTSVVLIVVTNVHYRAAGVYDRRSTLYQQPGPTRGRLPSAPTTVQ